MVIVMKISDMKATESNLKIREVHISTICAGDTILHDHSVRTVTNSNIKRSDFMGITIFGDSYKLGTVLVKIIIAL